MNNPAIKKSWNVAHVLFEGGYLVVTLAPCRGFLQNEKDWREMVEIMRGLAKVERGVEWREEVGAPWVDVIFPQTAFYGHQREITYDAQRNKAFRAGPIPYEAIGKDGLFQVAVSRMFDPDEIRRLKAWRIAAVNGCVDVYAAGKPWSRPNKSKRFPVAADVHGDIARRDGVPFAPLPALKGKRKRA